MALRLDETWCYDVLRRVRWPEGIRCPFCGRGWVTSHSKSRTTPRRRYLCFHCRKTFTDLTGTPFSRTHLKMTTWFRGMRLTAEGCSTAELARALDVKWDTASHLKRRLAPGFRSSGFVHRLHKEMQESAHE